MLFDVSTDFGARVARRLRDEEHMWLATVRADGMPQPTLIWFLWDQNETFLIYSQPNKQKLRNIAQNPKVALNFNSDVLGDDMIIFSGEASIDTRVAAADQHPAYLEKYRAGIQRIGMTTESFAQSYSVAIRVTPTKVRGW
jgi:PPOX class probable F420-dependent enzyme